MKPKRTYLDYVRDIKDAAEKAQSFLAGMSLEELLNERRIKAVLYVRDHGSIGNKEYQQLTAVKERTATEELRLLVEKKILERIGSTGRGTRYAAKKAQKAQ